MRRSRKDWTWRGIMLLHWKGLTIRITRWAVLWGLLPEVELEELLDQALANQNQAIKDFWNEMKTNKRVTKRPHITIIHRTPSAQNLFCGIDVLHYARCPRLFRYSKAHGEMCYGMDGLWREFVSDPRDKPYLEDSKWTCVRGCISRWVRGLKVLHRWKPSRWLSTHSDEELDVINLKSIYLLIRSYAITRKTVSPLTFGELLNVAKSYTSLRRVFTTSRKSQRSDLLYYFSLNHILLENNT